MSPEQIALTIIVLGTPIVLILWSTWEKRNAKPAPEPIKTLEQTEDARFMEAVDNASRPGCGCGSPDLGEYAPYTPGRRPWAPATDDTFPAGSRAFINVPNGFTASLSFDDATMVASAFQHKVGTVDIVDGDCRHVRPDGLTGGRWFPAANLEAPPEEPTKAQQKRDLLQVGVEIQVVKPDSLKQLKGMKGTIEEILQADHLKYRVKIAGQKYTFAANALEVVTEEPPQFKVGMKVKVARPRSLHMFKDKVGTIYQISALAGCIHVEFTDDLGTSSFGPETLDIVIEDKPKLQPGIRVKVVDPDSYCHNELGVVVKKDAPSYWTVQLDNFTHIRYFEDQFLQVIEDDKDMFPVGTKILVHRGNLTGKTGIVVRKTTCKNSIIPEGSIIFTYCGNEYWALEEELRVIRRT